MRAKLNNLIVPRGKMGQLTGITVLRTEMGQLKDDFVSKMGQPVLCLGLG